MHSRYKAVLFDLLRKLSYLEGDITLSSGLKSNHYFDCKRTTLTAEGHYLVGTLIHEMVIGLDHSIQAVGGLTMGADPLASAVASVSFSTGHPLNAFYIRKEPKQHGTGVWIEGSVLEGTPVVIVEDVVTTGGPTIKAMERAKSEGLDVRLVVALIDRQEGGREAIERENVPFHALYRATDFVVV